MNIKVLLPGSLRDWLGGKDEALCHGNTIGECIEELDKEFSGFKKRLLNEKGEIKESILFFINGDNVRNTGQGLDSPLKDNDEISILPFMAGGQY